MNEYINAPARLPSITGKDVIELEKYAKLPRTKTYERLQAFINTARLSKEVCAIFIQAEWGEGKSSIYEGFLQRRDVIGYDVVVRVETKTLIESINRYAERLFSDASSIVIGVKFFATLLYAIKGQLESIITEKPLIIVPEKKSKETTAQYIRRAIDIMFSRIPKESKVFIFIDEFEDILDQPGIIQDFIIRGLVDVINGHPEILCKGTYAGRIHFIIAVTPTAYAIIKSRSSADIGRLFGQRVQALMLERLTRRHGHDFVLGCLKYCYNGKFPKLPFEHAGMLNTIYVSSLGNPRSIVVILRELLSRAQIRAPQEKIKVISSEDFIEYMSDINFTVYGGEVNVLSSNSLLLLYQAIDDICRKRNINDREVKRLFHLFISTLNPLGQGMLKQIFGDNYTTYLIALEDAIHTCWGIRYPFLQFKKVLLSEDEVKNMLRNFKEKNVNNEFIDNYLDALTFYRYDEESAKLCSQIFLPKERLSILRVTSEALYRHFLDYFTSSIPHIHDEFMLIKIDEYLQGHEAIKLSDELYYMLAPTVISIFYPSPSVLYLDFVENIDARFKIGIQTLRNLPKLEHEFEQGVKELLKVVNGVIKVSEKTERHGIALIPITEIEYKQIEGSYKVRAYTIAALYLDLAKFNALIENIRAKMIHGRIPLLLLFTWNPPPNEVKGVISSSLPHKIVSYKIFPLSTLQVQQITAYVLAKKQGVQVNEEKWRARARRVIEEIKLTNELRKWFEEGIQQGFVVKPLKYSKDIRPTNVHEALRIFIICPEASVDHIFKYIDYLSSLFRVYGMEFAINPLDIESKEKLQRIAEMLHEEGIIKLDNNGIVHTPLTSIEDRIRLILITCKTPLSIKEIADFFALRSPNDIVPFVRMLTERKIVEVTKKNEVKIVSIERLKDNMRKYFRTIRELIEYYSSHNKGYLVSMKGRAKNAIIMRECLSEVISMEEELNKLAIEREEEFRKRYRLFEILINHINTLHSRIHEFYRKLKEIKRRVDVIAIKRWLENINKQILMLIPDKSIIIKEYIVIEEKEKEIRQLEERVYTKEELLKRALPRPSLITELFNNGLLLRPGKGKTVYLFEAKVVDIYDLYKDLEIIASNCHKLLDQVNDMFSKITKTKQEIISYSTQSLIKERDLLITAKLFSWLLNKGVKQ